MVDAGGRGRRRDRRHHERARGHGLGASERDLLPGHRGLLLRFHRQAQQGRLQRPEFSLGHVFLERAARRVARASRWSPPTAFTCRSTACSAAIDEQTLLVPISHVIFRSAYIKMPRRSSSARTRSARWWCSIPSSRWAPCRWTCRRWNADFVCGGVLKWLCGGPGVAYLYVRPDLAAKLAAHAHRLDRARAALRLSDRRAALQPPASTAS